MCLPGSAVSISLEYFPTPFGSVLVASFALALFIVVDLAWVHGPSGIRSGSVACRAASFALLLSSKLS